MPGRGDHGREQRDPALGDKIRQELRSALRLLFKSVEQQSIPLAFQPVSTDFLMAIPCEAASIQLKTPIVQVSQDPLQALAQKTISVKAPVLITEASLALDTPCRIEPALCKAPSLESLVHISSGVTFENVRFTQCHDATPPLLESACWNKPVEPLTQPAISQTAIGVFSADLCSLPKIKFKTSIKTSPKPFTLPIRKAPIPPHRFSPEARAVFRKALADKAGTTASNIQLKVVFERMNMALYASIQQDEQGNLLCVPKNEFIGRNVHTQAGEALLDRITSQTENTYLVVGVRLDNRQDIRSMVPVSQVPQIKRFGDKP